MEYIEMTLITILTLALFVFSLYVSLDYEQTQAVHKPFIKLWAMIKDH